MKLRTATTAALAVGMLMIGLAPSAVAAAPHAPKGGVCAGVHLLLSDAPVSADWGTATPTIDGVEYVVNDGWTVVLCAKGGSSNTTSTIVGPATGEVNTPLVGRKGNRSALSHWSVVSATYTGAPG
jgi:hypothetical protein